MNPAEPTIADQPDTCLGQPAVREQTHSPDSPVIAVPKAAFEATWGGCISSGPPRLNLLNAPVH
jgi:hypothetical protein